MQVRSPSITTPTLDLVITGGLSTFAMGLLLLWWAAWGGSLEFVDGDWIVLMVLINSTHFMASYRLLYVSREEVLLNRWSAIFVPAGLLGLLAIAAAGFARNEIIQNLVFASSVYLAWHYTGQAWGMVSAFGRILGVKFTQNERYAIRGGMRILLALHVLFSLSGRLPPAEWIEPARYIAAYGVVFQGIVGMAILSLFAGGWAFVSAARRGQSLSPRIIFPWLALYIWYPFWYFVPGGFLWVQISHALQYLAFPLRIEANRYSASSDEPRSPSQIRRHVALTFAGIALAGGIFLHGPPLAAMALGEGWYSNDTARLLFRGFIACVAIHHYFIDGAIWKLSNPKVRGELFSHLR